jgi:DNA-binding MarR family transcriptional regulator
VVSKAEDRSDPLPAKIVAALDRLARARRSHRQATASKLGLTPLQLELMSAIADGPPPEPLVGLLALELGVSQPTVTDSLLALERKRLLTRHRAPTDRRRTTVALTDAGWRLVHECSRADRDLREGVAALDRGEQETTLEALLALIGHLVNVGVIDVARTCLCCRFHEHTPGQAHRCRLLEVDLPTADLRVNCPEHEPLRPLPGDRAASLR